MKQTQNQIGQTLVETVVGIFVLTVGISTALGLAVSLFNASSSAVKQVIGAGLAREAVEAVFNMRSTNWLKGEVYNQCYNYTSTPAGDMDSTCHRDWLKPLNGGSLLAGAYDLSLEGSYTLDINADANDTEAYWVFTPAGGSPNFRLYYDATAATDGTLYKTISNGAVASDYFREVILEQQSVAPYNDHPNALSTIGPRIKVIVRVWWNDRGCAQATAWAAASAKCRVELVTYLANWRNY